MLFLRQSTSIFKIIRLKFNPQRSVSLNRNLIFKKQLSVPTFCNINVDVPFDIELKPLDVHEFQNCDKIFVELDSFDENQTQHPLSITQAGNNVYIGDSNLIQKNENVRCTITAPIKANLNLNSKFGSISIKNFNGEIIVASSESGNITVDKFQGKDMDIKTKVGDVKLNGTIQSSVIDVQVLEKGSISINKLLGEKISIETKLGNISVNSSYCNKTKFITEEGDMDLKNVHKHCEVHNRKDGNIKITGLDGQLKLTQLSGEADIHLSRITENSEINMSKGQLLLRLSEECQETTKFDIKSRSTNIGEDVSIEQINSDDAVCVSKTDNEKKVVSVNCSDCSVNIAAASWFDMNFAKSSS